MNVASLALDVVSMEMCEASEEALFVAVAVVVPPRAGDFSAFPFELQQLNGKCF
jgi:hypothetical protein